jgi:hypothetical protein
VSLRTLGLVAAALLLAAGPARADGPVVPFNRVVLQGLDKITARITVIEAPVGQEVAFGNLRILARTCLETPPTEPPESAAFLQIRAVEPDDASERQFSGWMFASSPSVSALENPVYDVWVIDCADPAPPPPPVMLPDEPATPPQNG